MKTSLIPLLSELDDSLPLGRQLATRIRDAIQRGHLAPGDRLPASRALARELGVARGTVTAALELLTAEGLLESRVGSGTFVSSDASLWCPAPMTNVDVPMPDPVPLPHIDGTQTGVIDFRPCRPSLDGFPLLEWRRCLALAANVMPDADYGDPRGELIFREQILAYLRRSRGLTATIDQIVVTNGAVHAMSLLASLYLSPRTTAVFEDPGYPLARQAFALTGARMHFCDVDQDGLLCDQLPVRTGPVRLAYVTPSHQFPRGSRLSLARRYDLVAWAQHHETLIVEDDYDGEFRFDVPPLAPLAALAPHTVVYCGTFSKTMFPGLRLGYAVAPTAIIDAMAARRAICEYGPPVPTQHALASFIKAGHYERHIHRMRRRYAARRRTVSQVLADIGAPATVQGLESGLSASIRLRGGTSARGLSLAAQAHGVVLPTLDDYRARPGGDDSALVCGYAASTEGQIEQGLRRVFEHPTPP